MFMQWYLERTPVHIGDAINKTLEIVEKDQDPFYGIPSGFVSLDRLTQGWQPRELTVIAARPAVGKTAFALSIARNAAVDFSIPTAFFSLEMSTVSLTRRLILSESGVGYGKLRGVEKVEIADWFQMESSLSKLSKAPLYIDDTCALTPEEFMKKVKELIIQHGVRLIIVDYIHLMSHVERAESLREKDDEVLLCLKEAAMVYGVSVIAISFIKRPTRKNYSRPILTDLDAYCPSAVDYADKIILLHRPSFLSPEIGDGNTDILQVDLAKNKVGDIGSFDLFLDKERGIVIEPGICDETDHNA